jgi:hypothetical protein
VRCPVSRRVCVSPDQCRVEPLVLAGETESPVFVEVTVADHGAESEYGAYGGAVGLAGVIEASAPGDPVRPGPGFLGAFARSFWALAFAFWALTGAACSAGRFLLSTGPIQACEGYGIWLSAAPADLLPAWTGHGLLGPLLVFPLTRLGLASWLLALIVFPVAATRLSRARWRPAAWAGAAMAGTALAALALFSYRQPPETVQEEFSSDPWCTASSPISHVMAPMIDWYEIPAAIGFLALAATMWWILTTPARPAARPEPGACRDAG